MMPRRFNYPRLSLVGRLEASVRYYDEAARQLGAAQFTVPTVTDEHLEAVHDELQQVATEPDPIVPEGAVWL